jgi:hypothetical protein
LQFILMNCHHVLSWMYICGYFSLSKGPNKAVI